MLIFAKKGGGVFVFLSTPHSIQTFGDKTTAVARTTEAFFRT